MADRIALCFLCERLNQSLQAPYLCLHHVMHRLSILCCHVDECDGRDVDMKVRETAGQRTQWVRALATLLEDPGSVPSTYRVVHNHLRLSTRGY